MTGSLPGDFSQEYISSWELQPNVQEATTTGTKRKTRKGQHITINSSKKVRDEELEHGVREIKAFGLEEYCSVLHFET